MSAKKIEEVIKAEEKSPVLFSFIITEDCKVTYKGHFLEYKKGDKVDPFIGKYLLETGAPIEVK